MMFLYRVLWIIAAPLLPLLWQVRARRGKEDRSRKAERFGHASHPRPQGKLVWLHAASVGESLSLLALIDELSAANPSWHFLMTTGTVTSATLMAKRLLPQATHQYVPFDHPACVARFVSHWKPDGVVWCESEVWPGMWHAIAERRIPAVLLNARMSEKSARCWARLGAWARHLFGAFQFVAAQTPADAERFARFTTVPAVQMGNLKFVSEPLPYDDAAVQALTAAIGTRPVWAMASTHAGEEEIAADIHWVLKQAFPNLLTIIVPRHPARADDTLVATLARRGSVLRRSRGDMPKSEIYVWDTLGEMGSLFAAVKVIAMGGSFTPVGGHNLIEPAQFSCAVICGPHMFNFSTIMETFTNAGGVVSVRDADGVRHELTTLLKDKAAVDTLGQRAKNVCIEQGKSLPRLMAALGDWQKAVNHA